ncbi:hypothetical protein GCM10027262_01740 [Nocardia tengchongensis]
MVDRFGYSEVGQIDPLIGPPGQQNIGRFHIPVQHAGAMRVVECPRGLADDPHRVIGPHRPVPQDRGHVGALDVLHGHPQPMVVVPAGIHRDDVRMRQPGGGIGLPQEPRPDLGIVGLPRRQHLQCDGSGQVSILGEVHLAHTAHTEQSFNGVPRENLPLRECPPHSPPTSDYVNPAPTVTQIPDGGPGVNQGQRDDRPGRRVVESEYLYATIGFE